MNTKDRLEKRCDDIYFPFDNNISSLDSRTDEIQEEVKAIQRQLATSSSIDKHKGKSIDTEFSLDYEKLLKNKVDIFDLMTDELQQLSGLTYHIRSLQFSIEHLWEKLHTISNATENMNDRWTRGDEATRSFMAVWFRTSSDL